MNNSLGQILTKIRSDRNYTQKDLADKLNVSDKSISRWETGSSIPGVDILVRISKTFKLPLQDLIIAAASYDENNEDLVKDIIKEFTERDGRKSKAIKIILAIACVIVVILSMTIIFTRTYNKFKVYRVGIDSEDLLIISGVYVETRIKDSLYIGKINIKNYEINNSDIITANLYYIENSKKYILHTFSDLENIVIVNYDNNSLLNDISEFKNELYLDVMIINKDGKKKKYNGKLELLLDFSNNKIFYREDYLNIGDKKSITLDTNEIKEILLKNEFKLADEYLEKKITNGYIYYAYASNILDIYYNDKTFFYKYVYKIDDNLLKVKIFDKNNIEIDNYKYNVLNDKVIECITGSCNNYRKVMKFLKENILNLLYS